QKAIDKLLDLALRQGALKAVDWLALIEGIDGRNRLDSELRGQLLVLVDIDLDQRHLAPGRFHDLFENRGQLLAGSAPGGPEVHQDGTLHGSFQDVLAEAGNIRILDDVPCGSLTRRRGIVRKRTEYRIHGADSAQNVCSKRPRA